MGLTITVEPLTAGDRSGAAAAARALDESLRGHGVAADRVTGVDPAGGKGTGQELVELILSRLLSPEAITATAGVIIAFLNRRSARKVVIRDQAEQLEIELTGASEQDKQAAIEEWLRGRAKGVEDGK